MPNLVKYFLLSFPAASCGLGYWQLKRLEWKKNLISNLESKLIEEPVSLLSLDLTKDIDNLEYRRIKVEGHYDQDPAHQIYLKPRPLIVNDEAILRGRTAHQANIGVNVITPFILANSNLRILVNRGWLALKGRDSVEDSAHIGIDREKEEVVGILRKSDKRPTYGLQNNELGKEWQIRDIEAMARVLKTSPILIDAIEEKSRQEGPIGGQTALQVRNEHLNYAITWFSLAAFILVLWYGKYGRRKGLMHKLSQ